MLLLFILQATKAPVKCVLSVSWHRPRSFLRVGPASSPWSDPKIVPTAWDPRSAKDQRVTWVTWIGGRDGLSSLRLGQAKLPERGLWPQRALLGLTQLATCGSQALPVRGPE